MTKDEHRARIFRKLAEYEGPAPEAFIDELAALWAIVDDAGRADADGLWILVQRAQMAELQAASRGDALIKSERALGEAIQERDLACALAKAADMEQIKANEQVTGLREQLATSQALLTLIHFALTGPEPLEKIAAIIGDVTEPEQIP